MKIDGEGFFAGTQSHSDRMKDKQVQIRAEAEKRKQRKISRRHYKLSLKKLIALSLDMVDITYVLKMPSWKMVALHVFWDTCFIKKPVFLDNLILNDLPLNRWIVDTVLAREDIEPPLTIYQKSVLAAVLKREEDETFSEKAKTLFDVDLRGVLELRILNMLEMSDELVCVLTDTSINNLRDEDLLRNKPIVLTLMSEESFDDEGREFFGCRFRTRCLKVAKRFSKGGIDRLSCKKCPRYWKFGHKREEQEKLATFTASSLYYPAIS